MAVTEAEVSASIEQNHVSVISPVSDDELTERRNHEIQSVKRLERRQSPAAQVLVVTQDSENRRALLAILNRYGCNPVCAERVNGCRELLSANAFAFVFCDRRLPDGTYFELLSIVRSLHPDVRLVVTSRHADWDEYVEALHYGAFDLIASPCQERDVCSALAQAQREDYKRNAFGFQTALGRRSTCNASITPLPGA
jgi:DNA-binding NtrC family response regulator